MEKYFALIKNNIVEKVIVATDKFLSNIEKQYDLIIDVTDNINRPAAGDSYYSKTKCFVSNNIDINHIPVDISANHMQNVINVDFKPFQLSKYDVKYENDMIIIGCKHYSVLGLFDALHKVLIEKQHTTSHFTTLDEGPAHGKFGITWDDAQKLYDTLKGK
jgi:hypothetical protein